MLLRAVAQQLMDHLAVSFQDAADAAWEASRHGQTTQLRELIDECQMRSGAAPGKFMATLKAVEAAVGKYRRELVTAAQEQAQHTLQQRHVRILVLEMVFSTLQP